MRRGSLMAAALTVGLCAGIGIGVAGMHDYQTSQPRDAQSTGTETVTMGDLKWLCLTTRTGAHIDARSCTLLDDMSGKAMQ